jgi:hypothetical protein
MNITRNGVTIQVDDAEIVNMVLQRLAGSASPVNLMGISVPRIGSEWTGRGGVYAGIMRGRNGGPDYHLIVGPKIDETNWEEAKAREKDWYWSCEQHAELGVYAWYQYFGHGSQHYGLKSHEFRARAVRRLVIR